MAVSDYLTCIIFLLPIIIWNILLIKKLPKSYQKPLWDSIPPLNIAENILRTATLLFPIILKIGLSTQAQRFGFLLYAFGVAIYFWSWWVVIAKPGSKWSKSIFGFMAPAYTTIVWLFGILLIGQRTVLGVRYSPVFYGLCIVAFVGIHTLHSFYVYRHRKEDA